MATNLRLQPDAEAAVRAEALRTGRSQQEIIREAVDRYVGISRSRSAKSDTELLVESGLVLPVRTPLKRSAARVTLPAGVRTSELLDRDDRH